MGIAEMEAIVAKGNFSWAVFPTAEKDSGYQVFGDRMEVTPNGCLVFYKQKKDGQTVVHVQAGGSYHSCEILSAWDGSPTNAIPLVGVDD